MVTYKKKKQQSTNKYITKPNVLEYLHDKCEKALDFCQQQQLENLEDFAQALEQISEQDNPKLKIAVEVSDNGITLSFPNKPKVGTTTGKYLMKNLGLEDENRFTRAGIEAELDTQSEDDFDDFDDFNDFDDDEQTISKSRYQAKSKTKNTITSTSQEDEIDDLLNEVEKVPAQPKPNSKNRVKTTKNLKSKANNNDAQDIDDLLVELDNKQTFPSNKPPRKTSIDYDFLLDQDAELREPTSENEFDDFDDEFELDDEEAPLSKSSSQTKSKTKSVSNKSSQKDEIDDLLNKVEKASTQSKTSSKTRSSAKTNTKNNDIQDIDDLLTQVDDQQTPTTQSESETKPKTQTKNSPSNKPSRKTTIDYDSLLDQAAGLGELAARAGSEIDGTTVGGLSLQGGALGALIGKKAAGALLSAATDARQQQQLKGIVSRLNQTLERTEQLKQREQELLEQLDQTHQEEKEVHTDERGETENEDYEIPDDELPLPQEQEAISEPEPTSKSPLQKLADVVNSVNSRLDQSPSTPTQDSNSNQLQTKPFQLDPNASFASQLDALNQRLDVLDQRLDNFEARLEKLETQLANLNSESSSQPPSQPEFPTPDTEVESSEQGISGGKPSEIPNQDDEKSTIYFDGGSRGNPGAAAGAAVLVTPDGEMHTSSVFLENATNNQAEYVGLIAGLELAKELDYQSLEIKGDSQLVVDQMNGKSKVKSDNLKPLHQQAQALLNEFEDVNFNWVKRQDNTLADQAVNECIDDNLTVENEEAQRCANTLLAVSNALEKRGEQIDNGVPIGEAILYASTGKSKVEISLESFDGEQLFAANKLNNSEGEWEITKDLLCDEDKHEVNKLEAQLQQLDPDTAPVTTKPQHNNQKQGSQMEA